ncbi:MAG: hypothetical protein IJ291_00205 [Lachnospiraceae bacterium]|nr:hypothetical protein [Lachnospiraceae bacterium]
MKRKTACFIALILAMGLSACSSQNVNNIGKTTVYVETDGNIVHTIVEDFGMPYYEEEGLRQKAEADVSSYNEETGREAVAMTSLKVENQIVKLQMTYENADDYTAFNNEDLFVGTIAEALAAGYDLKYDLKNPLNENDTIGEHELLTMQDKHIVIAENALRLRTEAKVLYASVDADFIDEYEVDAYENDGVTVIIY